MFDNSFLKKITEFSKKKKPKNYSKVGIQVISDVIFQPLDKYIPFFLEKFRIDASFKIGNYDQLNFDLNSLDKDNLTERQFIYIHSSTLKYLAQASGVKNSNLPKEFDDLIINFLVLIERAIKNTPSIQFIVNLFELPPYRIRGTNSTKSDLVQSILKVNESIINLTKTYNNVIIHDANYISASLGLSSWYDFSSWAAFKQPFSGNALKSHAASLAAIIAGTLGKSKKLLICDLDNTLWGGIIGDDGVDKIHLGHDTHKGEIFLLVQSFVRSLQAQGIVLGISSKNEKKNVMLGFSKKKSILKFDDFANKKINWSPKSENIKSMLQELNFGAESAVFIDDNPVEIDEVSGAIPQCECISYSKTPIEFIKLIDSLGLFETQNITQDDLIRNKSYMQNSERKKSKETFKDHREFLSSLNMKSVFYWNITFDIQRISNLVNKTNQFNISQKILPATEVNTYISDSEKFLLSADLTDKFGFNGIITVIFGKISSNILFIENWVMSCRVFNRNMEIAVLEMLANKAVKLKIKTIKIPIQYSSKNDYCVSFFKNSGFKKKEKSSGSIYEVEPSVFLKKIGKNYESSIDFEIY